MDQVLEITQSPAYIKAQEDFAEAKQVLTRGGQYRGMALMMPQAADIDEEAVKTAIQSIDLSKVIMKLTHSKFGLGWTDEEAQDAKKWYGMYLFLVAKYPDAYLVPNLHIDEFWHQHILDTRAYATDCETVFGPGKFHHHWPYAGMTEGDKGDYYTWLYNTVVTEQLFSQEFGADYGSQGKKCTCFGGKCRSVMP